MSTLPTLSTLLKKYGARGDVSMAREVPDPRDFDKVVLIYDRVFQRNALREMTKI